jgi:hypothetical protein
MLSLRERMIGRNAHYQRSYLCISLKIYEP